MQSYNSLILILCGKKIVYYLLAQLIGKKLAYYLLIELIELDVQNFLW